MPKAIGATRHDLLILYWYLEAVPELLALVGERMQRLPGALS